ncbi:MAG: Gfo/Idh/MocA family oxidoreductase [Planctomycetes bacterium]|nr:Gfo/Idh/MocA family oxidoreductase [Planctomycetota bacterium]
MRVLALVLCLSSCALAAESPPWAKAPLRAGIIGTDTSHVPAFTSTLHAHPEWKVKVTAAFKGGSPDVPSSRDRVEKYAQDLRDKHGVQLVDSIGAMLAKVDAVLIESVDGRPHLEQARPVLAARKPLFIDKPFTASLQDAREIVRLAAETGTPFFSCSCARFQPEIWKLRADGGVGKVTKVQGSAPMNLEPHHPDLFWYGIHGVEALYTVLGPGCVSVTRREEGDLDITVGTWKDGRVGVFRGVKKGDYKPIVKVWGEKGEVETPGGFSYAGLVQVMAEFFHTGKPPIDPAETLEIVEFMTAAQVSKDRGGAEVKLEELRTVPARPSR